MKKRRNLKKSSKKREIKRCFKPVKKNRKYLEKWRSNPLINEISEKLLYKTIKENERYTEIFQKGRKRYRRTPSPSSSESSKSKLSVENEDTDNVAIEETLEENTLEESTNTLDINELVMMNNLNQAINDIQIENLIENDPDPTSLVNNEIQLPVKPKQTRRRKPRDPNAPPIRRQRRKKLPVEEPQQPTEPPPLLITENTETLGTELPQCNEPFQPEYFNDDDFQDDNEPMYLTKIEEDEVSSEVSEDSEKSDDDFKDCPEVELKKILTLLHKLKHYNKNALKVSEKPLELCMYKNKGSHTTSKGLDRSGTIKRALRETILTRDWDAMTELLIILLNHARHYLEVVKNMCRLMYKFNPKIKEHGLEMDFEELINLKFTASIRKSGFGVFTE